MTPPQGDLRSTVVELRVHGVRGSPGPELLGYVDPSAVVTVERLGPVAVLARRSDRSVQGFEWGDLTSGSGWYALWALLLPFSLLNIAGWAHPRAKEEGYATEVAITHALVVALGWLLTATWTLWLADLVIGYGAYQWVPRATGWRTFSMPLVPGGALHQTLTPTALRGLAVAAGALLLFGVVAFAANLAGRSRATVDEPQATGSRATALTWTPGGDDTVFDDSFFEKRPSWAATSLTHLLVAGLAVVFVVVGAGVALARYPQPNVIDVDVTLLGVNALALVLLGFLAAASWVVPGMLRRSASSRSGPAAWAAATLAFASTNVVFSGAVLWVARYLGGHPKVGDSGSLLLGRELALTDAYSYLAAVWGLLAVALVVLCHRLQPKPAVCNEDEVVPAGWEQRVADAEGTARLAHKADLVGAVFAAAFWVVGIVSGASRLHWRGRGHFPWHWQLSPPTGRGFAYTAAAWLLPLVVVTIVLQVRRATGDTRTRRAIARIWDVLTFWPRRFHPFAVRPSAQVAVPKLRACVNALTNEMPVVVSAHSQGSVLAVAALAPLDVKTLARVALVTYGSPVAGVMTAAFPASFNPASIASLRAKLGGAGGATRWHNFFRLTDPVGAPMFPRVASADGCVRDPADHCLPDPAAANHTGSPDDDDAPPLEHDREPAAGLAVHSYYLNEPELKRTVATLKAALSAGT